MRLTLLGSSLVSLVDALFSSLCELTEPARLDPKNAKYWPSLLFLAELYNQALLTMGDDEFFASAAGPSTASSSAVRNPLALDDVVAFCRQLLNVAFTLYWTEDQALLQRGVGPAGYRWDVVREKITKCLVAIHAREYVPVLLFAFYPHLLGFL